MYIGVVNLFGENFGLVIFVGNSEWGLNYRGTAVPTTTPGSRSHPFGPARAPRFGKKNYVRVGEKANWAGSASQNEMTYNVGET